MKYPLSIRHISPSPGAVRLTGTRQDGLPDGTHTGGAWLCGNEVWKPLDGRPYANAECHYSTQEAEVLDEMADKPLFPRNWRIEEANGRRFLVRRKARIIDDFSELDTDKVLMVESAVRALNAAKWEIGDPITLAYDLDSYDLFIVDLSNAQRMTGTGAFEANDEWRIHEFMKQAGCENLVKLRRHARHVLTNIAFIEKRREGYVHVYASFNRPLSQMWCKIPESVFVQTDGANWSEATPHTWCVTRQPLDAETMHRYELRYGWSPIHLLA